MYSKFLLLLAALFAATLWFGCEESCQDCHWHPDLHSIQIVTGLQNDTLVFLPNDSTSILQLDVTVVVTNTNGTARQGEFVNVTLSDTSLGYLTSLGDMTDSLGRAYYYYHYRIRQGTQVVTAYVGWSSASRVIQSIEVDPSTFTADLNFDPDTVIYSQGEADSTILSVHVLSNGSTPVANFNVLAATYYTIGSYPPFLSIGPTDHNGYAEAVVYMTGGSLCCSVLESLGGDSVCVTVVGP